MNKYAHFYFSEISQKIAENPANHGVIFWPFKRTFGRPKGISDYAFRKMQERGRLATGILPDIMASNPINKLFGRLGENRIGQFFIDRYLSPGGSYTESFLKTLGALGNDLAGPGLKNLPESVRSSANFLKNVSKTFTDNDGIWDYKKSYGFNLPQTIDNLAAYNKQFGGFSR